jgi:cytochrome c oxidase subunit 2
MACTVQDFAEAGCERRGATGPRPSTKARGVPSNVEGRKRAARSGGRAPATKTMKVCGALAIVSAAIVSACGGPQSALTTAGRDAESIAELFWQMTAGALLIWTAVIGLAAYIIYFRKVAYSRRGVNALILGGGVALPTVILAILLVYSLSALPHVLALPPAGGLIISVSGEQWWWRVRYLLPDGRTFDLANEIRLPVGERIELRLESPDVIHSFWVPSLAGKIDMIPGRINRLAVEPTRTGTFRGACAEYCGASHAFMSFDVIVHDRSEFTTWLDAQQQPAIPAVEPIALRGQTAFGANGCGACHTIRGTEADGVVGPDLTHVGSRLSLAAGTLPNERDEFVRWLTRSRDLKPDTHMPVFGMLPPDDLIALATYLDGLR